MRSVVSCGVSAQRRPHDKRSRGWGSAPSRGASASCAAESAAPLPSASSRTDRSAAIRGASARRASPCAPRRVGGASRIDPDATSASDERDEARGRGAQRGQGAQQRVARGQGAQQRVARGQGAQQRVALDLFTFRPAKNHESSHEYAEYLEQRLQSFGSARGAAAVREADGEQGEQLQP